jgi:hypothetical protein
MTYRSSKDLQGSERVTVEQPFQHLSGGTEKARKSCQYSRRPVQELMITPLIFKPGALPLRQSSLFSIAVCGSCINGSINQ